MKTLFIILTCFALEIAACSKSNSDVNNTSNSFSSKKTSGDGCVNVTITNTAPGCNGWGIIVDGIKYPSANIPDEFKQKGITVCATYVLYEDQRLCFCCGGTWADIQSMEAINATLGMK